MSNSEPWRPGWTSIAVWSAVGLGYAAAVWGLLVWLSS